MNTQQATFEKISSLKEQHIALQQQIEDLQNCDDNIDVSSALFLDDYNADVVSHLKESIENPFFDRIPSVKSKMVELVEAITQQEAKKEIIYQRIGELNLKKQLLLNELNSFFKPTYVIQFNKAYDSSGELLKEVAIVAEHFKEYKSEKKYSDKFVIFVEQSIQIDTILNIISAELPNYDKNFRGKTSVEKLNLNFDNYHNFYLI